MTYVTVNGTTLPASISGRMIDNEWDGRESKSITMSCDFAAADSLFQDGAAWNIICEEQTPVLDAEGKATVDENGQAVTETTRAEFDNSEFCIRGDLTVHTDGTVTVKMGKATEIESVLELVYGGVAE